MQYVCVTGGVSVDGFLTMQYVCVVGSVGVTGGLISDYAVRVYNWWCECGPVSDCACPTHSHKGSLCFTLSVYLCVIL